MKKLFTLLVLIILVGCKKTTTTPATITAVPPTPSSTESQLVGKWIMDSVVTYIGAVRNQKVAYTDPIHCILDLKTDVASVTSGYWVCTTGLTNCQLTTGEWQAPNSTTFNFPNQSYGITLLTTTKFNFNYTDSGVNFRYYLHK